MAGTPQDTQRARDGNGGRDGVILSAFRYQLPTPGELNLLRDKAGLTKTEAAERVGVNRHTIRRWETGDGSPDIDSLRELLAVYRVEIASESD